MPIMTPRRDQYPNAGHRLSAWWLALLVLLAFVAWLVLKLNGLTPSQ